MRYRLFRAIVRFLFRVLTRTHVEGLENVPREGGCIVAVNHLSRLDPPIVFMLVDRDDLTALVADKYKHYPVISWAVESVNGIWLNRESADFQALRQAVEYIKNGGVLGIAPEGTRSRTAQLKEAKPGVAYLATKAEALVVPVGIHGTEKAFHELFRLRRPDIYASFGEPFHLPPLDRRNRSESLRRNTDIIMCRIAELLPPEYRGVYPEERCAGVGK